MDLTKIYNTNIKKLPLIFHYVKVEEVVKEFEDTKLPLNDNLLFYKPISKSCILKKKEK
jgi:hypothetical protein